MPTKPKRVQQTRAAEAREFDLTMDDIFEALSPGEDVVKQHHVRLPFGSVSYLHRSLTRIGGPDSTTFIPAFVAVDFSRDVNSPLRQMTIEVQEGVPRCTQLRFTSRPTGRGIRPSDLSAVDLAQWVEDILSESTWHLGPEDRLVPGEGTEGRRPLRAALRGDRRTITHELLAEVAEIYRANIDDKPIEAIRSALGLEYRTATRYVQLCRSGEFGLLPKTERGKRKA